MPSAGATPPRARPAGRRAPSRIAGRTRRRRPSWATPRMPTAPRSPRPDAVPPCRGVGRRPTPAPARRWRTAPSCGPRRAVAVAPAALRRVVAAGRRRRRRPRRTSPASQAQPPVALANLHLAEPADASATRAGSSRRHRRRLRVVAARRAAASSPDASPAVGRSSRSGRWLVGRLAGAPPRGPAARRASAASGRRGRAPRRPDRFRSRSASPGARSRAVGVGRPHVTRPCARYRAVALLHELVDRDAVERVELVDDHRSQAARRLRVVVLGALARLVDDDIDDAERVLVGGGHPHRDGRGCGAASSGVRHRIARAAFRA